jgi:hypothetical protein
MREYLIEFFKALQVAMPGAMPQLYLVGADRLALQLNLQVLFIDEGDFDMPVEQLVRECCAIAIGKSAARAPEVGDPQ